MTSFNLSNFINRAKELCTDPKGTWGKIKNESIGNKELYMSWIIPGAAIGPVAGFLGGQIFGITVPFLGTTWRPPFMGALTSTIVTYILGLVAVYLIALILSKFASKFGGKEDLNAALKLVAYSYTPGWLAGVLMIFPNAALGMLAGLAGLYGLYLLYVGIPQMVGVPEARRLPYFGLSVITFIVVFLVLGLIAAASTPRIPAFTPEYNAEQINKGLEQLQRMMPK